MPPARTVRRAPSAASQSPTLGQGTHRESNPQTFTWPSTTREIPKVPSHFIGVAVCQTRAQGRHAMIRLSGKNRTVVEREGQLGVSLVASRQEQLSELQS
jgi:hypothetical protein